jgi:hypothetical protein
MNSIKSVISEPISGNEEYHIMVSVLNTRNPSGQNESLKNVYKVQFIVFSCFQRFRLDEKAVQVQVQVKIQVM